MQTKSTEPVVLETKPATEWLLGAPVQKVSPRYNHALLQRLVAERLGHWAKDRGRVGTEWRFWVMPAGEAARYLVPDVAYVSYAKLSREARAEAQEPRLCPSVVFEIRSKDDRNLHVEHKVAVYLSAGADLVCILDPERRRLVAHDAENVSILAAGDIFEHPALSGFSLSLPELFAELDA